MLRVESMGVTYPGNVLALKPTNVHFHKGEFTVLLGLSGAGKSTLLRSLNHLVKPTTGKVVSGEFGELTNRRILRQHRSRTAMVFQHHQLIERYTALQNVLTGRLAYHGTWRSLLPLPRQDLELALQCLDRVGLADKYRAVGRVPFQKWPDPGWQRAHRQESWMVAAPMLWRFQPAAAGRRTTDLLGKALCQEDGITAVISLHQLEYAQRFADRIIGLSNAHIVFDDAPENLKSKHLDEIYHRSPSVVAAEGKPAIHKPRPPR